MSTTTDPGLIVYEQNEATLVEAAKAAKGLKIAGVEDRAGYEVVHKNRQVLKGLRVAIEKQRKGLNESALDWQRRVNAEAKRLTAIIEPVELELEAEQKRIDAEKERIRAEAAAAAKAKLDERVASFIALGIVNVSASALADLSDADFDETLATARAEHAARVERERMEEEARAFEQAAKDQAEAEAKRIEAERVAKERAELQRQREEQAAERKRLDDEAARVREEQRAAQAKLDADRKALEEERAKVEAAKVQPAPEPVRCATFAPAPASPELDKARAELLAEDDSADHDEREAIEAAKAWGKSQANVHDDLMRDRLDSLTDSWDEPSFALGYLAGIRAERARNAEAS